MIFPHLNQYHIILGSQSPRRRELLKNIEIPFTVISIDADESYPKELPTHEVASYLAKKKADHYPIQTSEMLITADTVVCLDKRIFNKPQNSEEAIEMLSQLSGKTHRVITGVAITTTERQAIFHTSTEVTFATLTQDEIVHYVENYRPYDKAGAYAIQEWIGQIGIENINGSYYNVMGLPIQALYTALKNWE